MNMDVQLNRTYTPALSTGVLAPVFAVALFTSATLLFWVQPLVAKMLLPLLGGAPAVWNTCMLFFQALLLAGYAYALFISQKLSLRNQAIVHAILLLIAGLVLPFTLSSSLIQSLPTQSSPVFWLLGVLLVTVGPPFFLLSATAPLLQRWFSHSNHRTAKDPYFLYAVSNAGSMLALLGFPFLAEPAFAIHTQNRIWAIGYVLLVAMIVGCAVVLKGRRGTRAVEFASQQVSEKATARQRLGWILLAFVPSSLMLGVTTYIATDVASVPLIWIVPLALYLLTFILAFSNRQLFNLSLASLLIPVSIVCLGALIILKPGISAWVTIALHLTVFFLIAFVSHRRLALSRPPVTSLAEYFLWIAVGGVLGGIFNALLAPLIFSTPLEYPLVVILGCLVRPLTQQEKQARPWWRLVFPSLVLLLTFALAIVIPRFALDEKLESGLVLLVPLVLCFLVTLRRPIIFAFALAAFMFAALPYLNASTTTLTTVRNFFGVWRVTTDANGEVRKLWHGSTVHGLQFNDDTRKCMATSYFHRDGPLGQVFDVYNSRANLNHVAVVGLGGGTIATYARAGQQWDFYDIDPAIVRLASDPANFKFLSDCTAAPHRFVVGDARLRLREAAPGQYGLLVMDAFSSDSVPAHLLTTEAFELYFSKLSSDGMMAFHISNRYLNLEPLLSGLTQQAGLSAYIQADEERMVVGRYPSVWVVMARNESALGPIPSDVRWRRLKGHVIWTDDFSNILSLLK